MINISFYLYSSGLWFWYSCSAISIELLFWEIFNLFERVNFLPNLCVLQVGAIVLYTYVFHMLAPPPGRTYDGIDKEESLPTKNPVNVSAPEQLLPLLTEEPQTIELDTSKSAKV